METAGGYFVIVRRGTQQRVVADFFRNRELAMSTLDYLKLSECEVRPVQVFLSWDAQ